MKYFIIPAVILVLVVGYFVVSSPKTSPGNTQQTENNPQMDVRENSNTESNRDSYVVYSENLFNDLSDKKRILFFHATWCPTCKVANKDIEDNIGSIPEEVVVFKTDYDTETSLKTKYGITYQHTFVLVDSDGNALAKWNGGGVDEIVANSNQ